MGSTRGSAPAPTQEPSPRAAQILFRNGVDKTLDTGPMRSRFGTGEIAIVREGLVLIDFDSQAILKVSWDQILRLSASNGGVARLAVEIEGHGPLKLTIPGRLATNIVALGPESKASDPMAAGHGSDDWVWQRGPLFVTNEMPQEVDLTSLVLTDAKPAIDLADQPRRSPILIGALAVVGLVVGFGLVSQLGSDSNPTDQPIEVAGITTTPGVITTLGASCHESYEPCVVVALDVDCEGGLGDGPAYVKGPIDVVGPDVYRLDTDGDGIACGPDDKPQDEDFSNN